MEHQRIYLLTLLLATASQLSEACEPVKLTTDKEVYVPNELMVSTCVGCAPILLKTQKTRYKKKVEELRYFMGNVTLQHLDEATNNLQIFCYSDRTGDYQEMELSPCEGDNKLLCVRRINHLERRLKLYP